MLRKVCLVKVMVFPVVKCGYESWTIKKAVCLITDNFKLWCWRRLLSPLESKIKPVNLKKKIQPWILFGRTDIEVPILWPSDAKSRLVTKDPDAGKDWRQKEKRATEDKMVGWHHRLSGHELEQLLGDGERQGNLECCSPWGDKESDMTWQLKKNNYTYTHIHTYMYICEFNPWLGRSPGGGHGNSLEYSCMENPMDRGAWRAIVHRLAKSWTWLNWLSTHGRVRKIQG